MGPAAADGLAPASSRQPSETPVVTSGDVKLSAHDEGTGTRASFCISLEVGDPSTDQGFSSNSCTQVPDPATDLSLVLGDGDAIRGSGAYGVAVPAGTVRAELWRAGVKLAAADTVAGDAYHGAQRGKVRFAILRAPAGTPADGIRVRLYDAAGTLTKVLDGGGFEGSPLVLKTRTALNGGGRIPWKITEQSIQSLAPSLRDPAREVGSDCFNVAVASLDIDPGFVGNCVTAGTATADALGLILTSADVKDDCNARFRLVYGYVGADVTGVSVLLADGTTVRPRFGTLSAVAARVYAVPVAPGTAVTAVRLVHRGGRVERIDLQTPPQSVGCASNGTRFGGDEISQASGPIFTPPGPVTTLRFPGGAVLRIADHAPDDDRLCVGLGTRSPLREYACTVQDATTTMFPLLDYPDGRTVAVVTPESVARLEVRGSKGTVLTADTVPGDGYTGRYAGYARFAAVLLPKGERFRRMRLLAADGHVVTKFDIGPDATTTPVTSTRRIAGAPGRTSLWKTTINGARVGCVTLTDGPEPRGSCGDYQFAKSTVLLAARCRPRRLQVGILAPAGARVTLKTSAGPIPVAIEHGAAVATLNATTALDAVVVDPLKGRTDTLKVKVPATAEQCGWRAIVDGDLGSIFS